MITKFSIPHDPADPFGFMTALTARVVAGEIEVTTEDLGHCTITPGQARSLADWLLRAAKVAEGA